MPFEPSAIDAYRSKSEWDATAAELLATMLERWHLTAEEPFVGGEAGSVVRVTDSTGQPAVLKVGFPHFEGVWEAVGLEALGPVAPTVLKQDAWTWSMLLERIEPGTHLTTAPLPEGKALDVAAGVLAAIHQTAVPDGLLTLEDVIRSYVRNARARFDGQEAELASLGVVEPVLRALDECERLAATSIDRRFLHGDFNPGNILFDESSDSWRVIDPKPMACDPAFDMAPMIGQLANPWRSSDPAALLVDRVTTFAEACSIVPQRAIEWAFARTGLDITWRIEDGDHRQAEAGSRQLTVWQSLL